MLVIDDDPAILQAITYRCQPYDLEVLSAYHGMHGIWTASHEMPDVIITDVRMPQGEGTYVMQCLSQRAETAAIPVIVLTGSRDRELEARLLRLGAAKVFHKPVRFDKLIAELAIHIDLRERS